MPIEMEGKRFGRLVVLKKDHKDKRGEWYWLCICDCGNYKVASGYKIRSGNTKSCGCLQSEMRKAGNHKTHGMTNSRLYVIWSNMRARCNNPKSCEYISYGGKGIFVCKEWEKFENFSKWAFEHGYSQTLTIDRINVNGPYSPKNCRWVTSKEQSLNRTDNHLITALGKTQTIREWADESGLKYDTIERRINCYAWSPEDAVTIKPWHKNKKRSSS